MLRNDYRRALIMLRPHERGMSGHVRLERRTLAATMRFTVQGAPAGVLHALLMAYVSGHWVKYRLGALKSDSRGQSGMIASFDPRNLRGLDLDKYVLIALVLTGNGDNELVMTGMVNGYKDVNWTQLRASALSEFAQNSKPVAETVKARKEPELMTLEIKAEGETEQNDNSLQCCCDEAEKEATEAVSIEEISDADESIESASVATDETDSDVAKVLEEASDRTVIVIYRDKDKGESQIQECDNGEQTVESTQATANSVSEIADLGTEAAQAVAAAVAEAIEEAKADISAQSRDEARRNDDDENDTDGSEANNERRRDDETSEQERSDGASEQSRNAETSERGRNDETSEQARNTETSERGRNDETSQRGRNDETSEQARNAETSERGRNDETSQRGRNDETSEQARNAETSERGRNDETSQRGRNDETSEQARNDETSERGRNIETSQRGRNDETPEQTRNNEASERGRNDETTEQARNVEISERERNSETPQQSRKRTTACELLQLNPESKWPDDIEAVRELFESAEASDSFKLEDFVFVDAPLPNDDGVNGVCAIGLKARDGKPVSVCYALPGSYSIEPPAGLEDYEYLGGWWYTVLELI